jgi:hypothetical protein
MIRVVVPQGLRALAGIGREVQLSIDGIVTQRTVLDALEREYPVLRGTIRDHQTQLRRPFIRFFACEQDLSHESPDDPLPDAVASGSEPFLVVGAIAGGATGENAINPDPGRLDMGMYRQLLLGGLLAGPLYVVVAAVQIASREGFDITRHPVSLLSNGDVGWVQILNFVISGALVIAAAIGIRAVTNHGTGKLWGPLLVGIYGLGLIGSGIFLADPADGFPPGTPAGTPETVTFSGIMHFTTGGIAFLGLIAACIVFARRFQGNGEVALSWFSLVTGVFFFVSFGLTAAFSGAAVTNLMLTAAVILGWSWLSLICWHTLRASATDHSRTPQFGPA